MKKLLAYVGSHRKALVAYGAAVVTVLAVALPHSSPWYAVVIAVAGALGVHAVPNERATPTASRPATASAPVPPPAPPPAV